MVNAGETTIQGERRERLREGTHAASLGVANLNPFGDLHTLQHLSTRIARSLRGVFEPILRTSVRSWVEPLVVQRFADYTAERGSGLTGWLPLAIEPGDARCAGGVRRRLRRRDARPVLRRIGRTSARAGQRIHARRPRR